jgi:hypothetical protein
MKNAIKLIGIIALVAAIALVFAFALAACGDGAGGGGGPGGGDVVSVSTAAGLKSAIENPAPGKPIVLTTDITVSDGIEIKNGANVLVTSAGFRAATATVKITFSGSAASLFKVLGMLALENITLTVTGSATGVPIVVESGGSLEIRDGTVITNPKGDGVTINGGNVTMSGGVIRDCKKAETWNEGQVITGSGIAFYSDGGSFTMTGGTISGNGEETGYATRAGFGISSGANGNRVSISGNAVISGNGSNGVHLASAGGNRIVTISGGTIKDNGNTGVSLNGTGDNVTISGDAVISGNRSNGVSFVTLGSGNNNLTMTGGTISGNTSWGLSVQGKNSGFSKTGGIIYGKNAGAVNGNKSGAIRVANLSNSSPYLKSRVNDDATGPYTAKLDSSGNNLDGAATGTWD